MVEFQKINFRKLLLSDLDLMLKWLNRDFVKKWYGKQEYSYEEILQKYGSRINGEEPVTPFLISYADTPIGFIQTYRISDYPKYNKYVEADEFTAGVDLFIGENNYLHKSFGTTAISKFVKEIVFSDENIKICIIGPETKNKAAIRSYEKAGFKYFKTIKMPNDPEPEYLMRIYREEIG